jgi:hypothetical protein
MKYDSAKVVAEMIETLCLIRHERLYLNKLSGLDKKGVKLSPEAKDFMNNSVTNVLHELMIMELCKFFYNQDIETHLLMMLDKMKEAGITKDDGKGSSEFCRKAIDGALEGFIARINNDALSEESGE